MKKTLLSILIASALLFSACSSQTASTTTASSDVATTSSSEVTTTTSYNPADYKFTWEYDETEAFEKVMHDKFNMSIAQYTGYFGFTDDFNRVYTDFINNRFNTDYKSVPFKKANYFFDYINRDINLRHDFDDYENFKIGCLNTSKARLSCFNNKAVLSYLIQNGIPLGEPVPIENFKSFMGDELYKNTPTLQTIGLNPKTGNYEKSYVYNKTELFELLQAYNAIIYKFCVDNSIKTCNLFEKPEVIEIYNSNLKKFYGIDVKMGEVLTKEQYKTMFGEEPLDLSYIPGAIVSK